MKLNIRRPKSAFPVTVGNVITYVPVIRLSKATWSHFDLCARLLHKKMNALGIFYYAAAGTKGKFSLVSGMSHKAGIAFSIKSPEDKYETRKAKVLAVVKEVAAEAKCPSISQEGGSFIIWFPEA